MVGRNEPCPCGSGKKYKKCCESKATFSIEEVQSEELERILQAFYEEYPERRDLNEFLSLVKKWSEPLFPLQTGHLEELYDEATKENYPSVCSGSVRNMV